MKKRQIALVVAGFIFVAVATSFSVFAGDKYLGPFSSLKPKLTANKAFEKEIIVQVGNEFITKRTLEDFRAYKELEKQLSNNPSISLKDNDLLEELITEKLLLQKAKEEKVEASLEDGKKEAARLRELLAKQPQEARDMQARVIESTGLSEEAYWNEYAPKQYQDQLTVTNLVNKLIRDGVLTVTKDPNEFGQKYREYRKQLYRMSLGDKVKVLDKNIVLNN